MKTQTQVSLIITTYNTPDFLERVLLTCLRQNYPLKEIIVTEDGRSESNKFVVNKITQQASVPLVHLQQNDTGNRKPLAMNRALEHATGDYLVFVDGDCLLRNDFVSDHIRFSAEDRFLTGRRVELSQSISQYIDSEKIQRGYLDGYPLKLYWDSLTGKTYKLGRMFKTPSFVRKIFKQDIVDDIRGCNFSVHKKNLVAINGFSNDFSGAYGEDSDVEHRLKFYGLKMYSIKGAAIQFHLWHQEQSKDILNQQLLTKVIASKNPITNNGLKEISEYF